MRWTRWLLIAALVLSWPVHAVKDIELNKVEDEARFQDLANELRCMVCQNQSIADSNADLARDFRNQVKEKINAGQTNEEIREFMIARYGDYILYRPPFNMATALLWLGPFVLVLFGFIIVFRMARRKRVSDENPREVDTVQQARLKQLLEDEQESRP